MVGTAHHRSPRAHRANRAGRDWPARARPRECAAGGASFGRAGLIRSGAEGGTAAERSARPKPPPWRRAAARRGRALRLGRGRHGSCPAGGQRIHHLQAAAAFGQVVAVAQPWLGRATAVADPRSGRPRATGGRQPPTTPGSGRSQPGCPPPIARPWPRSWPLPGQARFPLTGGASGPSADSTVRADRPWGQARGSRNQRSASNSGGFPVGSSSRRAGRAARDGAGQLQVAEEGLLAGVAATPGEVHLAVRAEADIGQRELRSGRPGGVPPQAGARVGPGRPAAARHGSSLE